MIAPFFASGDDTRHLPARVCHVPIVVILNPRSRANRLDPARADRFARILGDQGRVERPQSFEELDQLSHALAKNPPQVLGIHGGDGTLHKTVSALLRGFGGTALPPLAILPGGTMNVVASSLNLRTRSEDMLSQLADDARKGRPPSVVSRRCLRIGDQHGFVFGNGFIANFLEQYYRTGSYGPGRALWILARAFFSGLIGGRFSRKMFTRFEGRFALNDITLPFTSLSALSASTVREVGLGFKLNHRADEDPDKFSVLAITAGAAALGLDLWAVWRGRGISPRRAHSAVGSTLLIEPAQKTDWPYTIDGDLYHTQGPLILKVGPVLRFVEPRPR